MTDEQITEVFNKLYKADKIIRYRVGETGKKLYLHRDIGLDGEPIAFLLLDKKEGTFEIGINLLNDYGDHICDIFEPVENYRNTTPGEHGYVFSAEEIEEVKKLLKK